jgi:hypothetical protein
MTSPAAVVWNSALLGYDLGGEHPFNPIRLELTGRVATELGVLAYYEHLDHLNTRILKGCQDVIDRYNLPGYSVGVGSKGCVTFSPVEIVDYETFKANQDADMAELAWLFNMNRGIFMTPGREEEWTLSVQHSEADVNLYVAAFSEFCQAWLKDSAVEVEVLEEAVSALAAVMTDKEPVVHAITIDPKEKLRILGSFSTFRIEGAPVVVPCATSAEVILWDASEDLILRFHDIQD